MIKNESNDAYHGDTSHVSKSGLVLFDKSPRHYYEAYLSPLRQPQVQQDYFAIGSFTHAQVLEPALVQKEFFYLDDSEIIRQIGGKSPRATNDYRDWKAEQMSQANGRTPITADQFKQVKRMHNSIAKHPVYKEFILGSEIEKSIYVTCPVTGCPIKVRPDSWHRGKRVITDLKTIEDVSTASVLRAMKRLQYDAQDALYRYAVELETGEPVQAFVFLFVEKNPPHNTRAFYIDGERLQIAKQDNFNRMEAFVNCKAVGEWPGYTTEINLINW